MDELPDPMPKIETSDHKMIRCWFIEFLVEIGGRQLVVVLHALLLGFQLQSNNLTDMRTCEGNKNILWINRRAGWANFKKGRDEEVKYPDCGLHKTTPGSLRGHRDEDNSPANFNCLFNSHYVRSTGIPRVEEQPATSFILDETSDINRNEQVSVCIHFFNASMEVRKSSWLPHDEQNEYGHSFAPFTDFATDFQSSFFPEFGDRDRTARQMLLKR
ncbi:hypothetical protein LOD99_15100 [Oopsacas minuta]|uniref:Uncharacterized protein n=1 Tax=Oopsacas minuta TaxID=111878 RepID=A0AAV7KD49_9METZ|nr:hypothetical protein LOD99_15100 [Oopsacas minuta]